MTTDADTPELILKWGTIKGWSGFKEGTPCRKALKAYADISGISMSAMTQDNTPEHKDALCRIIDAVSDANGVVVNDWDGEIMDHEEAKEYVMEYRK